MAISSLTEAAHASTTTTTLAMPADIQSGDLLIIHSRFANSGSPEPADTQITDFTSIGTYPLAAGTRQTLYYKIATGSEASSNITVPSGTSAQTALGVVFRPNEPITAVSVVSPVGECTSGNPTSKTITAASGTPPLVVIAAWANNAGGSAISPRTQSPATTEINDNTHQYIGYIFYASSPSNQTFDMDDEGLGNSLNGCYLQLTGSTVNGKFFNVF